jgi:hypothetical protein
VVLLIDDHVLFHKLHVPFGVWGWRYGRDEIRGTVQNVDFSFVFEVFLCVEGLKVVDYAQMVDEFPIFREVFVSRTKI